MPQQRFGSDGQPTRRKARAQPSPVPGADYRQTPFWRIYDWVAQAVDHRRGWDKLPLPAGLAVLIGVRTILRQNNLHDPSTVVPIVGAPPVPERTGQHLVARSVDGTYNDLDFPAMGRAGARFGRNIPLDQVLPVTPEQLMEPNPREVSRRLLTRDPFLPATSVNTLAASWLQFMIHDWFTHGEGDTSRLVDIPLPPGDDWHENPMRIPRIKPDPTRPSDAEGPITSVNDVTHWWDGSSLYGTTMEEQQRVRTGEGGKLRLTDDGQIPIPDDPALDPTMKSGWWTGMGMLITLFAREHNAVCARLASEYPNWDDEELFQRARLVIAALLAKIHTVEWTPAVISHPTTVFALRANWFGVAGERIARAFGRISGSEVISGIPGAATEHYGVPFSLTEEFTSVYRMHPLLPDDFDLRTAADDSPLAQLDFRALAGPHSKEISATYSLGDLFYSFGTTHPGAIVLRNYPKFLQEYERPDGKKIDVASTDLVRIRELGVPRYCEFRRQMHLKAPASFAELTDDAGLAQEMADLYGDIEKVDLMVGLFAEKRPTGFAFSDTAFRIFILMASRRLNSDRFFTKDFRPEVYSPTGLNWIRDNDMRTVLLRHFPELRPALRGSDNAFAPWKRAGRRACALSVIAPTMRHSRAGRAEWGPEVPRSTRTRSAQRGNGSWPRCDPEDDQLMVAADDDELVLRLQGADQRVVEAQRAAAAGDRQDDVAQRTRVQADLAGGDPALVEVEALAAGDEVLDDVDHARRVGGEAEQPAGRRRRGDDRVGAGLPQQVGVLLLAHGGRDRHGRVELPHGQRDEDGGVVPVGRDDHGAGALHRRPPEHLGAAGVADDPGEPERVGLVDRPGLGIDDHDLVQGRAEGLQRADGAAPLGAVTAHDDVLAHAGPPATDLELLPRARGERLESGSDEDEQERDAQRRDQQDVDQPRARRDRRDVAVAGGGEGDGRVVDRVEQGEADGVAVPVAVAVEVDDRHGEGEDGGGDDDPAPHLAYRRLLGVGQPDAGVLGLRSDRLELHPGDSNERRAPGARRRTRSGQPSTFARSFAASSRLSTLPAAETGIASMKTTSRSRLYGVTLSLTAAITDSAVSAAPASSALRTT